MELLWARLIVVVVVILVVVVVVAGVGCVLYVMVCSVCPVGQNPVGLPNLVFTRFVKFSIFSVSVAVRAKSRFGHVFDALRCAAG